MYLFFWLDQKEKKATLNPKNKDDKCFQYTVTAALNYWETQSHPERVSNIKLFINKYKWKRINFLPKTVDWKTFETINLTIAYNIFVY